MKQNMTVSSIVGIYSLTVLISVYFMEFILGWKPCELCLLQRYPYFIIIIMSIAFMVAKIKNININSKLAIVLILAPIFTGLLIAVYHFGVENSYWRNISACSDQLSKIDVNTDNLLSGLNEIKPNCSDPVKIFGLSISGYNILSNILMMVFLFVGWTKFRQKFN
ncbi:MAG: disulfide bond formation protein B [Alphaproteobacteria bacterium]|nr:disulfide bond formation protein B [Alphaproteobacteria bacterium]